MAIVYRCECGHRIELPDFTAGSRAACPGCGRVSTVPQESTEEGERPAEAEGPFCSHCGERVDPEDAVCPHCGEELPERVRPREPVTSGFAITSLVLGIASVLGVFCCSVGGLLGIPAIVVGVIGLKKISDSEGDLKGAGLAKGGIGTGIAGLLLAVAMFVMMLLYAMSKSTGPPGP
jgi:uncharacterized paraquat-inducible protein A